MNIAKIRSDLATQLNAYRDDPEYELTIKVLYMGKSQCALQCSLYHPDGVCASTADYFWNITENYFATLSDAVCWSVRASYHIHVTAELLL